MNAADQHIALLRLSALGDCINASALVHAIASARPNWRISWILGPAEAKLLAGIDTELPGVKLYIYRKKTGMRGMRALVQQIRAQQGSVDVLLQLQLALRANLLSLLIPATRRIGFDWARAKEGHALVTRERIAASAGPHVLDAFFGVLPLLGITAPSEMHWPIVIPADAHAFAKAHLPDAGRYLLISPCSSHPLRNWRAERYAEVAKFGFDRLGLTPVLLGSATPIELAMAEQIRSRLIDTPFIDLVGKDTLKQLAALMLRGKALLSPDSGPAHLAQALGTPVVGLYAATNPQRSGPYRFRHRCTDFYAQAAQQFLGKSSLRWGQRVEREGVMDLIDVPGVCALLELACSESTSIIEPE